MPPLPQPGGASAWSLRAPTPGPSTAPDTRTQQTTQHTSTNSRPRNTTPTNRQTTYRIQLRKTDPNVVINREDIFRTAFEHLNAPLIRLTDNRTGYYAVTDDATAIDKLTSPRATELFNRINLVPITPPDLRAKKTVFVRQIDRYAGSHSPDDIKTEIETHNRNIKIETVIKIKDYTHIIKIVTTDTLTAQQILTNGFVMFHTRITPHQCEAEKYTHLQICFKCYKYEDHSTFQCKSTKIVCSECAQEGHTHRNCNNTDKQCLNCHQNHRTLASSCPIRKDAIKDKDERDRQRRTETENQTYAKIAQQTINQTNAAPKHQIFLTDKIHIKLTAIILEAHIASLTGRPFGKTLSDSLRTNFDIDTTFPDRDSQEIFNMYLGEQRPIATDIRIDPPTVEQTDTYDDTDDVEDMDIDTNKRKASSSPQPTVPTLTRTTDGADIRLYRSDRDKTKIPQNITTKYIIDEINNVGDYGLKLYVKDQRATEVYKDIAEGRLTVRNTHIRIVPHDQYVQMARISSSKQVKKQKVPQ